MKILTSTRLIELTLLVVLLLLTSAPCVSETSLKIGLMAELTGPFSQLGEDCRKGYEVARQIYAPSDTLGGKKVEFIIGDNQGIAKAGVTEFKRLVDVEGVVGVVTTRSPVGLAINPISKQKRLPVVGVVGHPDFTIDNEYAFRAWPSAESEGHALAAKSLSLGQSTAAIVSLEDDYFLAMAKAYELKLEDGGGEIVASLNLLPNENDFSSVVSKVMSKKPNMVLVNLAPTQTGVMIKKLREMGFSGQILSNFFMGHPDVLQTAGLSADGVYFVEIDYDKRQFLEELNARFQSDQSSPVGYSCYVSLATVLQAIREIPSSSSSKELYDALVLMRQVELLDETISVRKREIVLDLAYRRITAGKVEKLS